jgi:hypothetical protein
MVTDRAGLSQNALRFGARAHRPGIVGFEDAARVARQAVEVGESRRVGVGETGLGVGDVLDALVEDASGRIRRLAARFLRSDSYTRDVEVAEIGVGCHWNEIERAK